LLEANDNFETKAAFLTGVGDALPDRSERKGPVSALQWLLAPSADSTDLNLFESLTRKAAQIAQDPAAPEPERLRAIGLLSHADPDVAKSALVPLLDAPQTTEFKVAVVRALGQRHHSEAAASVLTTARWKQYTPALRAAVLASMLSRVELAAELLTALESGRLPTSALDSSQRNQLLKHKDLSIRQRAEALFQHPAAQDRMKVYEEHKSVLTLKPVPANGARIFEQACANCHRLDRVGYAVGPDLFSIRNQPKEAILLHVIVPEAEVMPAFASYEVVTKDGRTLVGVLAAETSASVTLRRALWEEEIILRSDIASLSASDLSMMPQELEKTMTRQDLADLIAYLKGEGN
jgi:putative heme-binding domain-containing protein